MLVHIFSDPDKMTLFWSEYIIASPQVNIWKWLRLGCWSLHLKHFRFLRALCIALFLYKYLNWRTGLPEAWIHFRKCTLKAYATGSQDVFLSSHSNLHYMSCCCKTKRTLIIFLGKKCCLATPIQLLVFVYVMLVTYLKISRCHMWWLSAHSSIRHYEICLYFLHLSNPLKAK